MTNAEIETQIETEIPKTKPPRRVLVVYGYRKGEKHAGQVRDQIRALFARKYGLDEEQAASIRLIVGVEETLGNEMRVVVEE